MNLPMNIDGIFKEVISLSAMITLSWTLIHFHVIVLHILYNLLTYFWIEAIAVHKGCRMMFSPM